ncbi:MAG: zinc-ribbon domain-containing protein [Promethearchaeota archaeon]
MIFDGYHSDGMFHMMDWGSDFWYLLIFIGIIGFIFITFILLYIMRKGTRKLENSASSNLDINIMDSNVNQQSAKAKFCPECGIELEENIVYCPACGTKILRVEANE